MLFVNRKKNYIYNLIKKFIAFYNKFYFLFVKYDFNLKICAFIYEMWR